MTPAPLPRRSRPHALVLTLAFLTCKPPPAPQPQPPIATTAAVPPEPAPPPPIATAPEPPPADNDRCKCPTDPTPPDPADANESVDEDEDEDEDEDAKARRARARKPLPKPLATRLRAALPDHRPACDVVATGPCFIHADFDGDARPDDAILVRNPDKAGGIAILWAHGGHDLLGAGRQQCWTTTELANLDGSPTAEPCSEAVGPDLTWISHWRLLTRHLTDDAPTLSRSPGKPVKPGYSAPGALGDALLLDGGDAAAALYRTSTGWTLMHLGY